MLADDSADEEAIADAEPDSYRRERRRAYRELAQRVDRVRKMRMVADKMRVNKLLVVRFITRLLYKFSQLELCFHPI